MRALRRILRPIVRLLIHHGVTLPQLVDVTFRPLKITPGQLEDGRAVSLRRQEHSPHLSIFIGIF